jgi:hypothetical protein
MVNHNTVIESYQNIFFILIEGEYHDLNFARLCDMNTKRDVKFAQSKFVDS